MPRPATGQVIERAGKRGTTYAIRFTLPGGERRQRRLGKAADGWTREKAEAELRAIITNIRTEFAVEVAQVEALLQKHARERRALRRAGLFDAYEYIRKAAQAADRAETHGRVTLMKRESQNALYKAEDLVAQAIRETT